MCELILVRGAKGVPECLVVMQVSSCGDCVLNLLLLNKVTPFFF